MRSFAALLVVVVATAAAQIDRIVATVNNTPITSSEWEQQERFEAMTNNQPWAGVKRSREALDRIIDRKLILDQMRSRAAEPSPEAIATHIAGFRQQLQLESDGEWKARLKHYGLLEPDVADVLAEQAMILRFIEERFRPAVQVPEDDVRRYYLTTYLPQFNRSGKGDPPPLPRVRNEILAVLTEQRVNDLFQAWLNTLRAQANIRRLQRGSESK